MSPKADDNLKNRKKSEGLGNSVANKPENGKSVWESMTPKLANPYIQTVIFSAVALLVVAAALLIIIYTMKLRTVTAKFRAATRIHLFMQDYNDSYIGKKPIQTFKGVEEVLGKLQELYARNDEVQKSIDEILHRVKTGWVPYQGHLYKIFSRYETFQSARDWCDRYNNEVPEIHSLEDQNFFADLVYRNKTPCWLGMNKQRDGWRYLYTPSTERPTLVRRLYWSSGGNPHGPADCAQMTVCPGNKRPNCWVEFPCTQNSYTACKMKPDPRWF